MILFLLALTNVSAHVNDHSGPPEYGMYQYDVIVAMDANDTVVVDPIWIMPYSDKSIYVRGENVTILYKVAPTETELDSIDWTELTDIDTPASQPAYYQGFSVPVASHLKLMLISKANSNRVTVYITLWKQYQH